MQVHKIVGPPGTGKTTRLLEIVEQFLARGVHPRKIAFISFTRAAAYEARDRALQKFNNVDHKDFVHFRTLHSLCSRLLGLSKSDAFMQKENYLELGNIIGLRGLTGENHSPVGTETGGARLGNRLLHIVDRARATGKPLRDHVRSMPPREWYYAIGREGQLLKHLDAALAKYKADNHLRDYTDIILAAGRPEAPALDVDVAIIDEAQDLTEIQWDAALNIFRGVDHLVLAGDDDQAIYEWNGAAVDRFMTIEANTEVLAKSYRLPRAVWAKCVELSDLIRNEHRIAKNWTHNGNEGEVLYTTAPENLDLLRDGNWFILARNRSALVDFKRWASKHGLPMTGSINIDHMHAINAWMSLSKGDAITGNYAKKLTAMLRSGQQIRRGGKKLIEETIADNDRVSFDELRDNFGFKVALSEPWWETLARIPDDLARYYRRVKEGGESLKNPRITLSTIHGVKGAECDNVMLLDDMSRQTFNMCEWSGQRYRDEEHRVFYVGASRARQRLVVASASSPYRYDYLRPRRKPATLAERRKKFNESKK